MRNVRNENIQEHSHQTAVLAHALCVIAKKRCGVIDISPERAALLALYHDATEIMTGDMPTPIKYYNEEIKNTYKFIESQSGLKIHNMLPKDLQEDFEFLIKGENEREWVYVKAADTLSAYIKCLDELNAGNNDFVQAKVSINKKLENISKNLPALAIFREEFLPAYEYSIDNLK